MADHPVSILFVCLGNICRSPMAEAVFKHTLSSRPDSSTPPIGKVDSCGTIAYHAGKPPDPRTMAELKKNDITSFTHSARKIKEQDLYDFDYILPMDSNNVDNLLAMRERLPQQKGLAKVVLFGAFGGKSDDEEVVDPFYGGGEGFTIAFEQMQRFSKGLLKSLEESASS